jgi:hypothetical protein
MRRDQISWPDSVSTAKAVAPPSATNTAKPLDPFARS